MSTHSKPEPAIFFILGGSGDLTYRKLIPALYNLFLDDWMPEQFHIVGIGRTAYSNEKYKAHLLEGIHKFSRRKNHKIEHWNEFSEHIEYLKMDVEDDQAYQSISKIVQDKEKLFGAHPNVIFYLAVAPQLVPD